MRLQLHILALVTDAWGGRGGIAQYNRDLLGALAACDAVGSLTVLPRQAPDKAIRPSGVSQAPARHGRIAYSLGALAAAARRDVDVVFCGHIYMAPLAHGIARLKGAKLVIQTHGVEAWPRPTPMRRAAVEAADLVLSVSRHTRAALLDWAAIAPEHAMVLANTVSDAFTPGDGSALRQAWGLNGRQVLLTVGRMDARERYKGHDRVIVSLPALGADTTYVVIGEGDDRARLEALARDTGTTDRVMFVGAQPHEAVLAAYRMADLFVMPSTGEGFGIAFLEAMACGTPAFGLGVAGARDALADGELGAAAAAEVELAAALGRALDGGSARGADLAGRVRSRFGRAHFRAGVDDMVQRLLEAA